MVDLLELGSEGNMGVDYVDRIRDLSPPTPAHEVARQTDGVVCGAGICFCDVYLCRREYADERSAQLCINRWHENGIFDSGTVLIKAENVDTRSYE